MRNIDALIAEHVFGWEMSMINTNLVCDEFGNVGEPLRYSTSIADAWLVVEKLRQGSYSFVLTEQVHFKWIASFGYEDLIFERNDRGDDTAPMAICLAALKAIGVEVPK